MKQICYSLSCWKTIGERRKKEAKTVDKIIGAAALASAKSNVNSACSWFFHQPKVPNSVKKLKKF